jgi:Bacterial protein of unknown function (DUF899)
MCASRARRSTRTGEVYYNYQMTKDGFDELPGLSVFAKDDAGNVYHTYSSYARVNEEVNGVFVYLDITPKGRSEKEIMDWVRRNDEYDVQVQSCCHSAPMVIDGGTCARVVAVTLGAIARGHRERHHLSYGFNFVDEFAPPLERVF